MSDDYDVFDVENGWSENGEPPPEYGSGGGGGGEEEERERQSGGEDFGNGPEWKIARMGHVFSGGGTLASGSGTVQAGGSPISRAGDVGYCLTHRTVCIVEHQTCSQTKEVGKRGVALCGYTYMNCGCLISEDNYGQEYAGR